MPGTFLERWSNLGADVPIDDDDGWTSLGRSLLGRHEEPIRSYHGTHHVIAVLETMVALDDSRGRDPALRLAAFLHDAIYDPTASDNEKRSAMLAETELGRLGVRHAIIERTARLIRATDGHGTDGSPDVALFLDADLAILGRRPVVYDAYAAAIRREYGHLTDDVFRAGRAGVLRMFLDRSQLFFTTAGGARFEQPARANLTRELQRLTGP